ncbi:DUF4129 domain-containing protein [Runella slithyformis]|uniref:Protein-glutamine gamma-glutamyltransferase-like C-terminal domain-containing protein n=1 Tax=Runella slithyformis (strain ATCC 29530 / DSM 19594 / LMG 11500 / NCIMB 11436 / LSU 4) TaxID=761193 RepID=A0A7U4E5F6_RUNSL|nr:DUF4129 domain-containing protein [Runella slithyformis]AEI48294.1 hypothetical protein Runsl_1870 [Runella slithyformis DSM 19594]
MISSVFKCLAFTLLLISVGPCLHAQVNRADTTSVTAPLDASGIVQRAPASNRLNYFRNDRNYSYRNDPPPPENPVAKFWYWFQRKLSEFLQSSAYENFWQYVILATIGGLAIWLLYKSEFLGGFLGRKAQEDPLAYNRITENIHELDFNKLIEEAIENRNYRLAVRMYYLKSLKQLTDKQLIHWQPTKTNRIYVDELGNSRLKADFERLTSQFEYVWYGEFSVSESEFSVLKEEFSTFSGKI